MQVKINVRIFFLVILYIFSTFIAKIVIVNLQKDDFSNFSEFRPKIRILPNWPKV